MVGTRGSRCVGLVRAVQEAGESRQQPLRSGPGSRWPVPFGEARLPFY